MKWELLIFLLFQMGRIEAGRVPWNTLMPHVDSQLMSCQQGQLMGTFRINSRRVNIPTSLYSFSATCEPFQESSCIEVSKKLSLTCKPLMIYVTLQGNYLS